MEDGESGIFFCFVLHFHGFLFILYWTVQAQYEHILQHQGQLQKVLMNALGRSHRLMHYTNK